MLKLRLFTSMLAMLLLLTAAVGCNSNSDTGNNPPPGGQREFASGDFGNGDSYQHTFNTARTMNYYCAHHGGPGLQGMSGTITVTAAGAAETFQVSIVASSLPNLSVPVGSTIRWTNNTQIIHTVQSDN